MKTAESGGGELQSSRIPRRLYVYYSDIVTDDASRLEECGVAEFGTEGPEYLPEEGKIKLPALAGADPDKIGEVNELRENDIHDFRQRLHALSPSNRRMLDAHLDEVAPPVFRDKSDRRDWASQLHEASSDRLRGFLDWNAKRTFAINADPEVQAEIKERRNHYKQLIGRAIMLRRLPEHAEGALAAAGHVPILVGDIFTVQMCNRGGVYHPKENVVVIGEREPPRLVEHELNHAVLGSLPGVFNEAFTTHAQQVLHFGQPDVLMPKDRTVANMLDYGLRRTVSAAILHGGAIDVPPSMGLSAYCEKEIKGPATIMLENVLAESYYGVDIVQTVQTWQDGNSQALQDTFPHIPHTVINDANDHYALINLAALSDILHGKPIENALASLRKQADLAAGCAPDMVADPQCTGDYLMAHNFRRAVKEFEKIVTATQC